ncbi:basic salivary proline-rich protein 4-like [Harpegnathos saltator]|uniref:basic salivary proline-rich protein 4-like n=1 Tax=Harpegnathos saltator TaxID=610380 RepID=UPI000DBEF272|nr:basic salivary proline-rich protein 4-like [Harpegnathos saltator]
MELDNYIDELAELLLKNDDDAAAVWRRVTETAEKGGTPGPGEPAAEKTERRTEVPRGPPPTLQAPEAAPPAVIQVSATEPPPLAPLTPKAGPSRRGEPEEPTARRKGDWRVLTPPKLGRRIGRPRKGPQIRPAPPVLVNVAQRHEIRAQSGTPTPVAASTREPTAVDRTITVITLDEQGDDPPTAPAPPPRNMSLLTKDDPGTPNSIQPGPVIRSNVSFGGNIRLVRDTPPPQARVRPIIQPPSRASHYLRRCPFYFQPENMVRAIFLRKNFTEVCGH